MFAGLSGGIKMAVCESGVHLCSKWR